MSISYNVNLRSLAILVALATQLLLCSNSYAQVIGLAPPMPGLSYEPSTNSPAPSLDFSTLAANDINTDRNAAMLDYIDSQASEVDVSHIDLAAANDLSESGSDWWPRFDTSSATIADSLTDLLSRQYDFPRLRGRLVDVTSETADLLAWNTGPQGTGLTRGADADSDLTRSTVPGELPGGARAVDGLSLGGSRGLLRQSPLSSPEPGSIALMGALCSVLLLRKVVGSSECSRLFMKYGRSKQCPYKARSS